MDIEKQLQVAYCAIVQIYSKEPGMNAYIG